MYLMAVSQLKEGKTVQIRPRGQSMRGKIESGSLVTIERIMVSPKVGDIGLCKVRGMHYVHLVKAVSKNRFQIGNNRGKVNGWVSINSIYGKVVRIEP